VDKYPWLKPVITILVTLVIAKIVLSLLKRTIRRAKLEKTTQNYLSTVFKIVVYGAAVLVIAGTLGFDVTSLVALFSVVGAAFALAAQGTLANFFAGIMLLMSKPLKSGEYVVLGGPGVEGIVQEISLMHTRLVTPDNRLVVVPNSSVVSGTVTNNSRGGTRRVDLNFSISYDADIEQTKRIMLHTLQDNSMVLDTPEPPFARITGYQDSSVTYTARFWTVNEHYWDVQFDLLEDIKKNLDAAGIEIPYNHLNVHLDGGLSQRLK
jgi:small conductance mechanosensitive channel